MTHGGANESEIRPRAETADWSAAIACGWTALFFVLHDASYLFVAIMFAGLWLQCRQRLVFEGRYVQRVGLRPVVLDLSTAEVVATGRAWWIELFFLGGSFQLRDADGHRLYLESWLWDRTTRTVLAEAAGGSAHS
jgi:hypothetical protein